MSNFHLPRTVEFNIDLPIYKKHKSFYDNPSRPIKNIPNMYELFYMKLIQTIICNNNKMVMFKVALEELKKANKEVYIMVGFNNEDGWYNTFYPPDEQLFTVMRNKLVKFLFAHNIVGIILDKVKYM